MTCDRTQLRNLSPEAQKFLKDYDARQKQQAQPEKPIEHVEPIHGWKCQKCGWLFNLPERKGIGQCPKCKSIYIKPHTAKDIVNAPLTPQEQRGKDMIDRIKQQTESPREPAPLVADDDWFDQEERAAMQAEGRSKT